MVAFCEDGNELCGFRVRELLGWLKYQEIQIRDLFFSMELPNGNINIGYSSTAK